MGGDGRLTEALKDQFQLSGISGDVADGEDAGKVRLAGGGVNGKVVLVKLEAPASDGAKICGQAEKREQDVGFEDTGFAVKGSDLDGIETASVAVQGMELIGDDEIKLARGGGCLEPGDSFRGGAEAGTAMDHRDTGDVLEGERPIDG